MAGWEVWGIRYVKAFPGEVVVFGYLVSLRSHSGNETMLAIVWDYSGCLCLEFELQERVFIQNLGWYLVVPLSTW